MQRRHAIGFVVFCLLSGSGWLVDNAFPSMLPSIERQSLHSFVVALAAILSVLFRQRRVSLRQTPLLSLVTASILLLGLPALLNEAAYPVSARSGLALFAMAPLFIIVGSAAFNPIVVAPQSGRTLMMPALVGFAGALLLPSFQFPSSAAQSLLFAVVFVAVLTSAIGSLWMHTLLRDCDLFLAVAILCGTNAFFLAVAALLRDPVLPQASALPAELLSAFLYLPQLFLFVWLLREVDPLRFGSRFLFVPLLSVGEGIIFLRAAIDLRMGVAIVLMAIGGAILLLWNISPDSEAPPNLGLR